MKASELPELQKIYKIRTTSNKEYYINGVQKNRVLTHKGHFVELPEGTVVNRSYIVEILFDTQATKEKFDREHSH